LRETPSLSAKWISCWCNVSGKRRVNRLMVQFLLMLV